MRELAERYAHRIRMWEVTNETLWGANWRGSNFCQQEDYVEWSFKTAERYFGANELIINEAHCRIWFSHRVMKAIIYWNLPDGYAAFAKPGDFTGGENVYYGGLCRFDMTPKPAYNVVKDLFGKEWRTAFARDVGGQFSFCGFHGTYVLEATSGGRTVKREVRLNPDFTNRIEVKI